LGFFICNKRKAIASIPLQFPCQDILDSPNAMNFRLDSLAKGLLISICKGLSLGFPCQGIFDFQFKSNEEKVDDLKGAKGFA
jgi:hypothetical protein